MTEPGDKASSPRPDHGGDLFRLVYSSRATVDGPAAFEKLTQAVVARSQANNAALDVTGVLLAHEGWFLQALEGPRRHVSTIFGVIGRDLRHVQMELLGADLAEARLFGRWSMCARAITPEAAPALQALDLGGEFAPHRLSATQATKLQVAVSKLRPVAELREAG